MLVDKLRVMLCFELKKLNSKFYASHPFLQQFFEKNKEQFIKLSSVLSYTASHSTFDSINQEFGRLEFVKREAILYVKIEFGALFLVFFLFPQF